MTDYQSILTKSDCVELVSRRNSDFQLINYMIEPMSAVQEGFMSQHLRLKCNVQVQCEFKTYQFFIKIKLSDDSCPSAIIQKDSGLDVFKNEVTILKFLCNENKGWLPEMLKFIQPNIIILEDLSERHFEMARMPLSKLDLPHLKCLLSSLVQMHAFSLNYEKRKQKLNPSYSILDDLDIFRDQYNDISTEFGQKIVKASFDSIVFLINEASIPTKNVVIENLRNFTPEYCEAFQPRRDRKFSAISHGDLWANNMMFKYCESEPIQCCLVDFQIMRYVPLASDILVALYINTTAEFRRKYMPELLDFYFDSIRNLGVDISTSVYTELCEQRKRPALVLAFLYKTFMMMGKSVFTNMVTDQDTGVDCLTGDRVPYIKLQLKSNPNYKKLIFEELQDIIEAFA